MTWLRTVDAETPLLEVLETHPALSASYRHFVSAVWSEGMTDPLALELARLRVAKMLGDDGELMLRYQPAVDAGLTEDLVDAVAGPGSRKALSEHQSHCMDFVEVWEMDAHAITDEMFADVARGFSPRGMMGFMSGVMIFDGACRVRRMFDVPVAFSEVTVVPAPRPDAGPLY